MRERGGAFTQMGNLITEIIFNAPSIVANYSLHCVEAHHKICKFPEIKVKSRTIPKTGVHRVGEAEKE